MDKSQVMQELEALGKERTKKIYLSNGAQEPLFGVATGAMKPLAKQIKIDQPLAEELYATGNYDAMYFAGIIADSKGMTAADYDRWMDGAYFYMLSDYVVAVTLAEADIAQEVADRWIASGDELRASGGWSCYCWLLGSRPDREFSMDKLSQMLDTARDEIHGAPLRAQASMSNFVTVVAHSYLPLHERAIETAEAIGTVQLEDARKAGRVLQPAEAIRKLLSRSKPGFKRKYVRC